MANDMGLPGLMGGAGVGEAIARLLAQRLARAQFAEQQKQHGEENTYRNRALDLTEKTRGDMLAENTRQHDLQSRAATISARSLLPQGADISEEAQSGYEKAGVGDLSAPNKTLGSVSLAGLSPLQGSDGSALSVKTPELPQRRPGFKALPTFAQLNTDTDNARQSAKDAADKANRDRTFDADQDYRNRTLKETERFHSGSLAVDNARLKAGVDGGKGNVSEEYRNERATRNLQSVDELMGKVSRWTTGAGSMLSALPETSARNFKAELETLKANVGFAELAEMRAASKTGGALGQVSDREISLLTSTLGALDTGQSPENIKRQLQKVKDSINRWNVAKSGGAKASPSHAPSVGGSDPLGLRK